MKKIGHNYQTSLDFYEKIMERLQNKNIKFIVDTTGESLLKVFSKSFCQSGIYYGRSSCGSQALRGSLQGTTARPR